MLKENFNHDVKKRWQRGQVKWRVEYHRSRQPLWKICEQHRSYVHNITSSHFFQTNAAKHSLSIQCRIFRRQANTYQESSSGGWLAKAPLRDCRGRVCSSTKPGRRRTCDGPLAWQVFDLAGRLPRVEIANLHIVVLGRGWCKRISNKFLLWCSKPTWQW